MPGSTNKLIKLMNKGEVAIQHAINKGSAAMQHAGNYAQIQLHLNQLENLAEGKGRLVGMFNNEVSLDAFDEEAEELYQEIDKHFSTTSDEVLGAFLFLPAQLSRLVGMACGVADVQAKHKHEVKKIIVAYTKAVYSAGAAVPLVLTAAKSFFKGIADLFPKRSFIEKMFSKWADKIGNLAKNVNKKIDDKVGKLSKESKALESLISSESTARNTLQPDDKLKRS